jgi:hypothetical protein
VEPARMSRRVITPSSARFMKVLRVKPRIQATGYRSQASPRIPVLEA